MSTPRCAPGFDCAYYNSCPKLIQPCPVGYFCGSYEGYEGEAEMDYRYAVMKYMYSDQEVTHENAASLADPNRAIQTRCLPAFNCPNSTSMKECTDHHWCAEATVSPLPCGPLALCSSGSSYELNFLNLVMAVILFLILFICSTRAVYSQLAQDRVSRQKTPNSSLTSAKGSSSIKDPTTYTSIEICVRNVTYSLPNSDRRKIIDNFSATFPAGKMSLILGPSGSGKTTLLNIIRTGGKGCSNGKVNLITHSIDTKSSATDKEGADSDLHEDAIDTADPTAVLSPLLTATNIDRNNDQEKQIPLAERIGLVPQADILDRKLTVREQLLFHTMARSQVPISKQEANIKVEKVLTELGIPHIADAVIGGGENAAANISGGQLKRVNIACELVAIKAPSVLLLDEPTSGLDAAVAYELIECINLLKRLGNTIIIVLQQPRNEIFDMMDHLLLMDTYGSLVFQGQPAKVASHLQALGYEPFSEITSDADFCIDVLNTMYDNDTALHEDEAMQSNNDDAEAGTVNNNRDSIRNLARLSQQRKQNHNNHDGILTTISSITHLTASKLRKSMTGLFHEKFHRHLALHIQLLVMIRLRDRGQILTYMMINIVMAVSLSSGFSILFTDSYTGVLSPPAWTELQGYYPSPLAKYSSQNVSQLAMNQLLFFMGAALGCASALSAVPVFVGSRAVAIREHSSGISFAAFGFGRIIGDLPFVLVNAMVFAGTWCSFGMPGLFQDWLAVVIATAFASSAIGYLCTVLSLDKNASVYAIIFTFLCCVFSGSDPTVRQVQQYSIVVIPWYLSFGTWTSEATYITWSYYLRDNGDVPEPVQQGADYYGYDVSHGLGRSIGALIALGIAMRLITIIILVIMH